MPESKGEQCERGEKEKKQIEGEEVGLGRIKTFVLVKHTFSSPLPWKWVTPNKARALC